MPDIFLNQLQIDILKFFAKNSFAKNFYWTGGTLLAYQYLHHRDSVDLDFFSDDLFSDNDYLIFINELYIDWQKYRRMAEKYLLISLIL